MKIAILTNFMEFQPGYSLTGIVKDQVDMLMKNGHDVHLFVNSGYNGESFDDKVTLHKKVPFTHLTDYKSEKEISQEHHEIVEQTRVMLVQELKDFDFAFTHDFVFTGWFMIYGRACRFATPELPNLNWLHWIHSVPSVMSDWWAIQAYGQNHKLVFPNETDRLRVAEQYRGTIADVRTIPHIKDLRTFFDFSDDTCRFIDKYPAVMQANIVQILPASVDRLSAKRVKEVTTIFSEIKKHGNSVCLVIACQWATGRQQKEDVNFYRKHAVKVGLIDQKEIIFTSDFETPKYDVGIPKHMIRELFMCSNLFIFPTKEESFGLVVPEASLAGGVYMVLNKSLQMQTEISGNACLYFDFGSHSQNFTPPGPGYWEDIAKIVMGRIAQNESIMTKTFMRKRYNMDNLYQNYYEPIMAELKNELIKRKEDL